MNSFKHLDNFFITFVVAARVEQIQSAVNALQTQVKSQFRMNLLKEPRNIRQMKVEDLYYNEEDDDQAITDKLNLTVECAKVAMSVDKLVSNEVKTNVKSKGKAKATKKKSSILSQGPGFANTGVRRSTRKRTNPSSFLISSTPLASSTLTAAALGMIFSSLCGIIFLMIFIEFNEKFFRMYHSQNISHQRQAC